MHLPSRLHCLIGGLAVAIATISFGGAALAHTGFESSTPGAGDVIDVPVSEIVITFTGEATAVGEGFSVLDPGGVVRVPSAVSTEDDKVFVLGFDPPLVGGDVGVRWEVQAQDAHPINGSFSFTVTASAPTTLSPAANPTSTSSVAENTPATSIPATTPAANPPPSTSVFPAGSASSSASGAGAGDTSLEEFLAVDSSIPGEGRQLVGRIVGLLGVIGALGGLAFLVVTLRGTAVEIRGALTAVGGLGAAAALGAGVEYWGTVTQTGESFWDSWTSTPGAAMALRVVGGVAITIGALVAASGLGHERVGRSLSAAVVDQTSEDRATLGLRRWNPRVAPLALAGAAIVTASFWFDGHTVSKGPRVVHALVNSVHVVAASVWAGGVVALALTMWTRHRRHQPSRATELIVRFSTVASAALAAVVGAGALMAIFVLDSPGELTSTEWGKTLLLKTGAVALAAVGGAYNSFRLRPALEAAPDDPELDAEFRGTLVAEAILLTFVTILTAWLAAAAT